MFIKLNEWYCHNGCYMTKPLAVNVDEISDIHEKIDPYHNTEGAEIVLKNGKNYPIKEDFHRVMKMIGV